ncbi:MAG: DUF342 domain-containing protein [Proteobacteria bacterium]|nr:DUF342 domain-containing protein [Pseudomonadota bacterium]
MAELPASPASGAAAEGTPTATASNRAADLMPLPGFIQRFADGLYVALPVLETPARFHEFIERVFSSDLRFAGLDYTCMQRLLYDCDSEQLARQVQNFQKAGRQPVLRLAADIVEFPQERQQHYHDVNVSGNGDAAEYRFEPVYVEVETPPAEGQPVADAQDKMVAERVSLSLDEFIAAMWRKGVRFGIDTAAVAEALASSRSDTLTFASKREPKAGSDASVQEVGDTLHRDNTPKLLPDGRVDLFQFQNRFPQVEKHTRLFRKIPLQLGQSGWNIRGNEMPAELPRDLDLSKLAGIGARIERNAEGEFVVADMNGFLQIDKATQSVSISEKIVNHDGVSLRTTGNLTLSGDEYEEHGEVEEHTQVEGKNMTFMANVFGNIVSRGGKILFRKKIATGTVKNTDGAIIVEGGASNATLIAPDGAVTVNQAEGCLIVGKKVTIGVAINCDIYADDLDIESAEACAIGGKRLQIGSTAARNDIETMISLPVPDLSEFERQREDYAKKLADCEQKVQGKTDDIAAITAQPDVKNFSMVSAKLRAGQFTMSREQDASWQKLQDRVAPLLRQLKTLNTELQEARYALETWKLKAEDIARKCDSMAEELRCTVQTVTGETIIRSLKIRPDAPLLQTLPPRELRTRLRDPASDGVVLFDDGEGEFVWEMAGGKGGE